VTTSEDKESSCSQKFRRWFLEGMRTHGHIGRGQQSPWPQVMCLTGVDYFSTLGYQPGIAYLAAGLLSPLATLILVVVTLFGALPVYRRVAAESPRGQGSIAMLEHLLAGWRGKAIVLILLGFAATDFVITITLSAADATAHVVQNPYILTWPAWTHDRMLVTLFLLSILGAIFLKGFREAIGISTVLVVSYLVLNAIILAVSTQHVLSHPSLVEDWWSKIFATHQSPWSMLGISLLLFPRLALGLSGFETGVAVMPLIKGQASDADDHPAGRIANTRWLLTTAALIMSVFLVGSSIVTTLLIPDAAFRPGGAADGRALAYLAHEYLGNGFGTVFDISSILILWFAGASAMAGLLNLVPRYLPRYGMAPAWASATRPLVTVFTGICFVVTILFKANVDAQAGAYATGVLVLITSAAVAVTISSWRKREINRFGYLTIAAVFVYTTVANMLERPEGLQIASFFIATILCTSLISRAMRSTELRIKEVRLDSVAEQYIEEAVQAGEVRLLAHVPGSEDYQVKVEEARYIHSIQKPEGDFIFIEVVLTDPSEFVDELLEVSGMSVGKYRILKCGGPATANAIAALLLYIRDRTGKVPNVYMGWTEGSPLAYILRYIFLGQGETAPVTREILRRREPDLKRRPKVHVA
jgi:hypothetical protein